MKLSELIHELTEAQKMHGDVEVKTSTGYNLVATAEKTWERTGSTRIGRGKYRETGVAVTLMQYTDSEMAEEDMVRSLKARLSVG